MLRLLQNILEIFKEVLNNIILSLSIFIFYSFFFFIKVKNTQDFLTL